MGELDAGPIQGRWRRAQLGALEARAGRIGDERRAELRMAWKPADVACIRARRAFGQRGMTLEAEPVLADDHRPAAAMLFMALGASRRLQGMPCAAAFGCGFDVSPDFAMAGKAGIIGHPRKRRAVAGGAIRGKKPVRVRQFARFP